MAEIFFKTFQDNFKSTDIITPDNDESETLATALKQMVEFIKMTCRKLRTGE